MFKDVVSVGFPAVVIQALNSQYAKVKSPEITPHGVFLPPRGEAKMITTGCPLILASADWSLAAYAGNASHLDVTVDIIVRSLVKRRKSLVAKDVVMCLHFGSDEIESLFIEQAHQAGLKHFWVGNSLNQHPRLARAHKSKHQEKQDIILVRRTV